MELFQNILVGITVGLALLFIYRRFFKTTTDSNKSCGPTDCGCK